MALRGLRSTSPERNARASAALVALGAPAVPEVVSAIRSALAGQFRHRELVLLESAALVLSMLGQASAPAILCAALRQDSSKEKRAAAARALGILRTPDCYDALVYGLRDVSREVRREAAFALLRTGDLRSRGALEQVEGDPSLSTDAVMKALAVLRPEGGGNCAPNPHSAGEDHGARRLGRRPRMPRLSFTPGRGSCRSCPPPKRHGS